VVPLCYFVWKNNNIIGILISSSDYYILEKLILWWIWPLLSRIICLKSRDMAMTRSMQRILNKRWGFLLCLFAPVAQVSKAIYFTGRRAYRMAITCQYGVNLAVSQYVCTFSYVQDSRELCTLVKYWMRGGLISLDWINHRLLYRS